MFFYTCFTLSFECTDQAQQFISRGNNFEELKNVRRALPIYPARQKIIAEIRKFSSSIVIGETGSGKTTQLPQVVCSIFDA